MRKQEGFTLIELLVVIAVIALLMAILMPALSRAKRQARNVTCRALVKQWGPIWFMYCNDNNGYFPTDSPDIGWTRGEWIISLRQSYETKSEILLCPMATQPLPSGGNYGGPFHSYRMGSGGWGDLREYASFGQNNWMLNPRGTTGTVQGREVEWHWRTMNVKRASEIPVFADTMWRGGGPKTTGVKGDPPRVDGEWSGAGAEMKHFCIDRHEGTNNHLFLDWSVRSVGLKELWTLKWHKEFNTAGHWTRAGGVMPSDWPEWMQGFKEY